MKPVHSILFLAVCAWLSLAAPTGSDALSERSDDTYSNNARAIQWVERQEEADGPDGDD
ncbi:hypothetical protein BO94DRAFT_587467 [Aspergillus sclerotioniger CBS 115572]|uniref:Uncharacterized protein n=1 Tax=Aspergillus sclerotioniger CBS 115572 TaxID=1450535 RepID=A0A317WC96_9EURO|nr:hypothetical protein BO94DRAFT_587467 [Aspergillus sclerotioniger CBS 115572]PWY81760.1 hypothetical protein BO94DRAFT_587467 [Aspergillus sclerotioniger CBS 115572]